MEATPTTPFVVTKPELRLEFFIIAFNAPAKLGVVDQIAERNVFRKRRKPVFGRLLLSLGPLDQQPFLLVSLERRMSIGQANAQARKARRKDVGGALPPFNRLPGRHRQFKSNLLHIDDVWSATPPFPPFVTRPRSGA